MRLGLDVYVVLCSEKRGSLRLACWCTRRPEMSPVALDRPVLILQILSRGLPEAVLLRL